MSCGVRDSRAPDRDRLSNIVAKELAMSSRSLSRALAKLGTSFHAIVETLRKNLAHKYLEQGDLNLKEITFLLGYADISGFNHAFKRWTGKTSDFGGKAEIAWDLKAMSAF